MTVASGEKDFSDSIGVEQEASQSRKLHGSVGLVLNASYVIQLPELNKLK